MSSHAQLSALTGGAICVASADVVRAVCRVWAALAFSEILESHLGLLDERRRCAEFKDFQKLKRCSPQSQGQEQIEPITVNSL